MMLSAQYDYQQLLSHGEDIRIHEHVVILHPQRFSIGHHIAIDWGFYCTTSAELGDYIHIAPFVTVIGGAQGLLKMGHFTNIAAGGRIICASDEFLGEGLIGPRPVIPEKYRDRLKIAPVIFENFANTGSNVVIMPGVTLGEGSVVGACSLVTKSTEPWTIYTGVPARPVKARRKDKMIEMAKEMGYVALN